MNRTEKTLVALAVLAAFTVIPALAAEGFDPLIGPYDAIHQALAGDSVDGVAEASEALAKELGSLAESVTAEEAGVSAAELETVKAHVADAADAAKELAGAADLEAARAAFGDLSAALVAWRSLSESGPAIAYCPMLEKYWLEADAETLENPYYGSSMLRCGSIKSQ